MKRSSTLPDLMDASCQSLMLLLPAYSMGTATPEEIRQVEAKLPFCPEAQAALADYTLIRDALLTVVPMNETPPPVKHLLQRIEAQTSSRPSKQAPAHSSAHSRVSLTSVPTNGRTGVSSAQSRTRDLPNALPVTARAPTRSRVEKQRSGIWIGVAAACILVTLLGTNLFWYTQIEQLRRDQQLLLQTWVDQQRAAQPTFSGMVHHRTLLAAEDVARNTEASFVWNSGDQVGALVVNGLPALNVGETYQLWLVNDEHSLSLGTFRPDDTGIGVVIFQSTQPITDFSHIGVNIEPAGGTDSPTSPHLIIGNI